MTARVRLICVIAAVVALAAAACSSGGSSKAKQPTSSSKSATSTTTSSTKIAAPKIQHVFVINLENKNYDQTWGPASPAPYLSKTLTAQGELLTQYFGIAHVSLGNYIAQISGQAPDPATRADCITYTDFKSTGTGELGQALGNGCVYPKSVKTVADQLTAKGRTWRTYQEDIGNSATEPTTCRHPPIGETDPTVVARKGDQYATRHDPFVYFHSIIDSPACTKNVVGLDRLETDLASAASTPNLVYISPNLCHDGHDAPCVDGQPGGLASADTWLKEWVPKILASPAYKQSGLLIITFDEAELDDSSACCATPPSPNVPTPGGGRIGAVVLSPSVKAASTNTTPYNHYALLCSIEDAFGLDHLGFAGAPGLRCFGPDVYNAKS
jgi:phosphatidylinositol-3-phosphatase